ncbi:MAG TPA: magnesium/cobalt transporter CorA [Anaeromyxobacteraceae bacterium]|nr:magnesium/cobalt transporter CorA [Anaeromyxobacteraceae bacterium]
MLINCAVYQDGKRIGDITPAEIAENVDREDRLVWVALQDPTAEELESMRLAFRLHPLAVEDAGKGHQLPKVEEYGESLFVVLHTVETAGDELVTGDVSVFVGPNYVLSVRSRTRQGFADVRARCEREPELLRLGPAYVLYALMDAVVDRYFPVIVALEAELERVEGRIFAGGPARATVEALYDLKQKMAVLQHAVRPLQEATGKLHGGRVPQMCMKTQDYFRDVYDHLQRISQSLDNLRDMVSTAMSVSLSLITLAENETTKRLAAYGALVAVPTMVAGIYGMNFAHMPELQWAGGYPFALGLMVVLDVLLFIRLRRVGWL